MGITLPDSVAPYLPQDEVSHADAGNMRRIDLGWEKRATRQRAPECLPNLPCDSTLTGHQDREEKKRGKN